MAMFLGRISLLTTPKKELAKLFSEFHSDNRSAAFQGNLFVFRCATVRKLALLSNLNAHTAN